MAYLAAAVIFVGLLSLANLLLSLGLIRRLRAQRWAPARPPGKPAVLSVAAGQPVGEFTATTVAGQVISAAALGQLTLVGFFTTSCPSCRERLPDFLRYAAAFPGDVLAVAVGRPGEGTADLAGRLAATGNVLVEDPDGPVGRAFGVRGYPALCVLDPQHRVLASGTVIGDLPTPVPA